MISAEIYRKIVHLLSSTIPLSYLWFFKDKFLMIYLLGFLSLISVLIEFFRNKNGYIKYFFNKYFYFMLRKNESKGAITGATWLLFGNIITIYLYPIYIAVPALLFLSIGDSFAAIIGKFYSNIKLGEKSLTGSLAGILSSIICVLFVNQILPTKIIILGAIFAMIIELIPNPINDNLTIPIISGLFMVIIL